MEIGLGVPFLSRRQGQDLLPKLDDFCGSRDTFFAEIDASIPALREQFKDSDDHLRAIQGPRRGW